MVKLVDGRLMKIATYINEYYEKFLPEGFQLDHQIEYEIGSEINLYQLFFGFGKLIVEKFPYLFGEISDASDIESVGFNLVNACLVQRNTDMKKLNVEIFKHFPNDAEINLFLVKILDTITFIDGIFSKYLKFKNNERNAKPIVFHTELQICSVIANCFLNRHVKLSYNEVGDIESKTFDFSIYNSTWGEYQTGFRKYGFITYLKDTLSRKWSGTGDKQLDEISKNFTYYSSEVTKESFISTLRMWYENINKDRNENDKISDPKKEEKLLLKIVYVSAFTAADHLDDSKYDIEHLIPKNLLKKKLKEISPDAKLPISSFANLCLLPEGLNRSKGDQILYDDRSFLDMLADRNILISDFERKFSITRNEDLEWVHRNFTDYKELHDAYFKFLDERYKLLEKRIVGELFRLALR